MDTSKESILRILKGDRMFFDLLNLKTEAVDLNRVIIKYKCMLRDGQIQYSQYSRCQR